MFETAEVGHKVRKSVFKRREPQLRKRLLELQYELLERKDFPVIIVVAGLDGAGKSETFNLLNEWMDPRHIRTVAFGEPTKFGRERPEMWRYWQTLPPKGRIGILVGSWYTEPLEERVFRGGKRARFETRLARIRAFERMLVAEGVQIVKLWFHLSKKDQKKRLDKLASDRKTAWRVTDDEWHQYREYDKYVAAAEEMLSGTSTGEAPWEIVDGADDEYRALTVGALLEDSLASRLAGTKRALSPVPPPPKPPIDKRTVLDSFDYTRKLDRATYRAKLDKYQGRLNTLMRGDAMRDRSLVVVFEGMDAAGKGSTIRRATQALDARYYRVIPIAAPSEEERAQPYLWRFWRQIPGHGRTVIFDRSWYGRVLVERVEGFAPEGDWMRAYSEINEFEDQLTDAGAIVVKFWLAITAGEQLRRFKEREKTSYKRYKITAEDWRNRKKWPQYALAVNDMIERTSTEQAPWHVVASDDKLFSRIEVLKALTRALEKAL
jgi:AMP-polyphosphate phosphotransferase